MSWSAESRLAEKIRERVANCVLFELQDPRISFVTVTRVRLSRDMSKCRVFYSVLGSAADRTRTAHALRDAAGYVQREVAKILRTRVTPHLEFAYDDAIEGGMRITSMLEKLEEERDDSEDPESSDPAEDVEEEGRAEQEPSDLESPDQEASDSGKPAADGQGEPGDASDEDSELDG